MNFNFKDILAKQGSQAAEQAKKQEEEKTKFEGMKAHFTAGNALLDQERKAKDDAQKLLRTSAMPPRPKSWTFPTRPSPN